MLRKKIKKIRNWLRICRNCIFKNSKKRAKKVIRKNKKKVIKFVFYKIVYPYIYKKNARNPIIDNKVIFIEPRLIKMTNSLEILFDELVENYDFNIHTHYLRNNFCRQHEYIKRSMELVADMATAKYIFLCEANDVVSSVKMRKNTSAVQLWHGCGAFKKFGFSTVKLIFGGSKKQLDKYPFYKNLSLVTVSSPEVVWAYEEAMRIPKEKDIVKPIGVSRTDVFYDKVFIKNSYNHLYKLFPAAKGKKVILYAPTFRGRVANGKLDDVFDMELFRELLGDEYVLINKYHPLIRKRPKVPESCINFAKDYTDLMSIEELICVSDVCISYYSSLIYEYSLFEKPLIFFAYDLDDFNDWRGFYYSYEELTPGPIYTNNLDMITYIKSLENGFDKTEIHKFREKFMSSCDGHSTERILKEVFKDDLNKYKRETPLIHAPYHLIPQSKYYFSTYYELIEKVKKDKVSINKKYSKVSGKQINEKLLTILTDKRFENVCSFLEKNFNQSFEVKVLDRTKIKDNIEFIATSKYIVTLSDYKELSLLRLREETKVIRIPRESFNLNKFNYSSIETKVGLYKDLQTIARLNYDYDLIPVMDKRLIETYSSTFDVDDSKIKEVGSIRMDILQDSSFKTKVRDKFDRLYPGNENKKIILYLPYTFDKYTNIKTVSLNLNRIYEYFHEDYIVLVDEGIRKNNKNVRINKYYKDSIYDVSDNFETLELESIADIAIGDYREELYEIAMLNKPVYLLLGNRDENLDAANFNYDYNKYMCGKAKSSTEDIIVDILNDNNGLIQNSANFNIGCSSLNDGQSINRLITMIKNL
ncbi:MAG: CDP-glycerol glycerophosphotransferase family protein [Sphaerochaeta sp.]